MAVIVRRIEAPATGIVTRAEAKAQCRIDHADDDTLIDRLVALASTAVQERAGKALVTQDFDLVMASASGNLELPLGVTPVQSILAIAYVDADGVSRTGTVGDFLLTGDDDRAVIKPKVGKVWPTTDGQDGSLTISLRCGFGALAAVPENLRHAALMLIGHWFENRESTGQVGDEISNSVRDLIGLTSRGWVG